MNGGWEGIKEKKKEGKKNEGYATDCLNFAKLCLRNSSDLVIRKLTSLYFLYFLYFNSKPPN